MLSRFRFLLRNLFRRRQADQDLEAELGAYAEEMNRRQRRRVQTEPLREEVRGARLGAGIEGWARDLRYAGRMLRKAPLLTLACVATFALGIGANTVVFSMANDLLWRTPPMAQPQQINFLRILQHGAPGVDMLPPEVEQVRQQTTRVFSGVAAASLTQLGLSVNGHAETMFASYVTGNFFSLLGVRPALGRFFFAPAGVVDRDPELVLSYAYWRSRFGGDPGVVGRAAAVNGQAVTIVGVGPKDFHGISDLFDTQAFLPMGLAPAHQTGQFVSALPLVRRRQGVSLQAAQAELNLVAARMAQADPKQFHGLRIQAAPLGVGLLNSTGQNPFPMVAALFLSLSGLVLLLAAANVMGLLLARASTRRREMAVRAALGGGRRRLARQVFLETLLLALAGGAAGMALGIAGSRAMSALPPTSGFPLVLDFSFDWRVFFYGLAMALSVALAAGLVPAWRAAGADPNDALRSDHAGAGRRRQRLRSALVAAQVAGSLALLIVGGLFVRSLRRAETASLGFNPSQVWNFSLDADGAGYNPVRGGQYYAHLLPHARAWPGVVSASLAQTVPFDLNSFATSVRRAAAAPQTGAPPPPRAGYSAVSDGYFATMRVPLLQGRDFKASDDSSAAAVAVVSQTMARRLWPGGNPIGQTFVRGDQGGHPLRVVGVAGDVIADFSAPIGPFFYVPLAQSYSPQQTLQVRLAPAVKAAAVEQAIARLDPNVPVGVQSMDATMDGINGLYIFHLGARLAIWLGLLGLGLALVGVYGVVAYTAAQRTHEIGIRVALGAQPRQVVAAILRQALAIVTTGMGLGLLLAAGIGKLVGAFLVGISGLDPLTFALASLALGAVALAASLIPAWRATRADPLAALRCE
ncbi:MAG TPA: ADOP family duplicated permease [Terriglobales bacterium]|nr:ADOP family duplicated permease [Terriglobales bacterium]